MESLYEESESLLTLLDQQKQWRLNQEEKDRIEVQFRSKELMKQFLPLMILSQLK